MSARVGVRLSRNVGVSVGPVGLVLALPFIAMWWTLVLMWYVAVGTGKAVAYAYHQVRHA